MGNIYSLLDLKQDDNKTKIIQREIIELEQNIKNIDEMLKLLNKKCEEIMTKVVELDNKTYEIIDIFKNEKLSEEAAEWDYYDMNQHKYPKEKKD